MKIVDLCAATGLLSHAFAEEGFEVVGGIELDPAKAEAWRANHGDRPCVVKDVLEIDAAWLRRTFNLIPEQTVLVGGIPCADFSTLNQYKRMDTTLRDHVMRIVEDFHPAAYAFENVPAAWHGVKGVQLVRDCDVGGYTIRERGFWMSRGEGVVPRSHGPAGNGRLDGGCLLRYRGWGEALKLRAPARVAGARRIPRYAFVMDMSQQDDWENRRAMQVRASTIPIWTVTGKCDFLMWWGDKRRDVRFMTPPELALLQGFPEGWRFPKSSTKTRNCIGDAVPLSMGRAVARAIRRQVLPSEADSGREVMPGQSSVLEASP